MSETAKLLIGRLRAAVESHGALAEFCRKSGIPRRTVENWLKGTTIPTTALDAIATGLDTPVCELLKPPAPPQLQKTGPKLVEPAPMDPIQARFDRIEAQLARLSPPGIRPDVLACLTTLDEDQWTVILGALEGLTGATFSADPLGHKKSQ